MSKSRKTNAIRRLTECDRYEIRWAVSVALEYWPNAHLGTISRQEDIRRAFRMIRSGTEHYGTIQAGISHLQRDAHAHADM